MFERRVRQPPPQIDLTPARRLEAIRQSLQTLEVQFESLRDYPHVSDPSQAFELARRKFRLWQWVDVLDTVNQWLEAQVIEVSDESGVYINYSGWAERWDEWLDCGSPRIQFFRTFTKQNVHSPMQSPVPVVISPSTFIGEDIHLDASDLMLQSQELLSATQCRISQYHYLSRAVEHESQTFHLVQPARGDSPIATENSTSEWSSWDAGAESEESEESWEWRNFSPAKLELMLRGTQLSVISDRMGRILSDLASFSDHVSLPVRPMPSQMHLTEEPGIGDLMIHVYHLQGPNRRSEH